MNKLMINGNWNVLTGKLKQKWSKLTADDDQYVAGRQVERLGRMQKRTGKRREAVEKVVEAAVYSLCCD